MVPCTALQKVKCVYCVQCMRTKGEADRRRVTVLPVLQVEHCHVWYEEGRAALGAPHASVRSKNMNTPWLRRWLYRGGMLPGACKNTGATGVLPPRHSAGRARGAPPRAGSTARAWARRPGWTAARRATWARRRGRARTRPRACSPARAGRRSRTSPRAAPASRAPVTAVHARPGPPRGHAQAHASACNHRGFPKVSTPGMMHTQVGSAPPCPRRAS